MYSWKRVSASVCKGHKEMFPVQHWHRLFSEIIPTLWVGFIKPEVYGSEEGNEPCGPFSSKLPFPNCDPLATTHNKEIFTLQKKVSRR